MLLDSLPYPVRLAASGRHPQDAGRWAPRPPVNVEQSRSRRKLWAGNRITTSLVSLARRNSAVDVKNLARDKTGCRRAEEKRRARDILRIGDATEWNAFDELLPKRRILHHVADQVGIDESR